MLPWLVNGAHHYDVIRTNQHYCFVTLLYCDVIVNRYSFQWIRHLFIGAVIHGGGGGGTVQNEETMILSQQCLQQAWDGFSLRTRDISNNISVFL